MFKPAEEMVYIGLDEESRTKGKAAIDVAGAQTGKSVGSVLQQACLRPVPLICGFAARTFGLQDVAWKQPSKHVLTAHTTSTASLVQTLLSTRGIDVS